MTQITTKISSNIRNEEDNRTYEAIMPKIFYNLFRPSGKKTGNLKTITYAVSEILPDALVRSYKGNSNDLIHLPFQDTKCISKEYIEQVSRIFKDLYSRSTEKRYT